MIQEIYIRENNTNYMTIESEERPGDAGGGTGTVDGAAGYLASGHEGSPGAGSGGQVG